MPCIKRGKRERRKLTHICIKIPYSAHHCAALYFAKHSHFYEWQTPARNIAPTLISPWCDFPWICTLSSNPLAILTCARVCVWACLRQFHTHFHVTWFQFASALRSGAGEKGKGEGRATVRGGVHMSRLWFKICPEHYWFLFFQRERERVCFLAQSLNFSGIFIFPTGMAWR